jgi:hypothetical protein
MQLTPFRYCSPIKSFRKMAGLFPIIALCVTQYAWSQQPHLSVQNPPTAANTPRQVISGTARIMQAYDPSSKLRVAISIKAPKMAEEEEFLKELQNRKSPNFHKWLTPDQWNARFAPAPEDEQAVVDWAKSQGLTVTARYPNRLMVDAEGTVEQIQKAFEININKYEVNGQMEFSNDRDPVIPANLAGVIEYVDGLNSILRMRPASKAMKGMRGPDYSPGPARQEGPGGQLNADKAAAAAVAEKAAAIAAQPKSSGGQTGSLITNGYLDPSDIWSSNLYDYNALQAQGHCCNPTNVSGGTPPQTSIGLATDGDFADSDMVGFHDQYPYLAYHYFRHFVDGTPSCCDDETTLDLEWSTATSNSEGAFQNTSSIHVYETAQGFGTFGDIFQQMLTDNVVNVVNISYGLPEDYLNSFGLVNSWHGMFNQMIGQGWTIMAAAGDGGASAGCGDAIAVLYPESDPDVVSVGGTQVELFSDGSFASEVAWTGGTTAGSCSVNNGGTGGGCSNLFAAPGYQSNPACGSGSRSVPDIALNAATGQNYFFSGSLSGVGGTSISSPMMSGFIAQQNAYLLSIGLGGSPLGEVNNAIYYQGNNPGGQFAGPHYPFYDVTSGCNSNDITAKYALGSYCAHAGYDLTTGWGSFNALQLAWAINSWWLGGFESPTITFSGPSHTQGADNWYNTDQTVSWTVTSNAESGLHPTGVAGYSAAWDSAFSDPFTEPTPGSGNSFYSGPEFRNATTGSLDLASAGQGCHFAAVDAWDNAGYTPGNQYYFYLCYDTVAPVSTATLSGTVLNGLYDSAVKVTITSTDATSGVAHAFYSVDGAAYVTYGSPFTVSSLGAHTVTYYSKDVAGNTSSVKSVSFTIKSLTTTALTSSLNPSSSGQPVILTATVTPALGGTPTGSVTFYHGGTSLGVVTLTGNAAKLTISTLGAATTHITATYNGGFTDLSSTSATLAQVVNKASTTTTLTGSPNPAIFGQSVTLTATVKPAFTGTPGGTVTFFHGGTSLGTGTLSGGVAKLTVSGLGVGTTHLTATFPGSDNFATSTSAIYAVVVNQASTTTTLTSSNNPSNYGESVTLTATVTPSHGGSPGGTVTFFHLGTALGTGTISGGVAKLTVSNLGVGVDHLTATYAGSANYLTSTSSALAQTVGQAVTSTSLVSSKNPSTHGTSVTFTATVVASSGPAATGSVTFKDGSTTLGSGTLNSSGEATFSTSSLAVGSHSIVASYGGNTNDGTSFSATLTQKVN